MGKKTYETMNGAGERAIAVQDKPSGKPNRLNFSNPTQRDAHLQAFLAWLPKVLHDAPGIDWEQLPSPLMGYLIRTGVFVNDIGGQFRINMGATVARERDLDNQIRGPVASGKGDHLACANKK